MNIRTISLIVLLVSIVSQTSWAQHKGSTAPDTKQQARRIEISPYGGYLWSQSIDVSFEDEVGKLDATSGPVWGIEADIYVMPGGQLVLLYQRQETELTYQTNSTLKEPVGDVAIEYWQVGALGEGDVLNGKIVPFGLFTLGATRFISKDVGGSDVWKFSIIFGVGAKIYLSERIGLRVQGLLPWIITSGSGAISCGGSGCYSVFSGTGIVQAAATAGLIFAF